jgi:y4mF family transcriptional regulator
VRADFGRFRAAFGSLQRHPLENQKSIRSTQDIGETIKLARKAKKINQQTLADLANVGRRFVSELENGKPTLEFNKVIDVASAAGINLIVQKR